MFPHAKGYIGPPEKKVIFQHMFFCNEMIENRERFRIVPVLNIRDRLHERWGLRISRGGSYNEKGSKNEKYINWDLLHQVYQSVKSNIPEMYFHAFIIPEKKINSKNIYADQPILFNKIMVLFSI